jgi:hypothetical protein
VLLFLIFLIGFLENGRCEGKKGKVKKKKKKSGVRDNNLNSPLLLKKKVVS